MIQGWEGFFLWIHYIKNILGIRLISLPGITPIKFIDLDGSEPAEPGTKQGQSGVAVKKGTEDSYNWSWSINKKSKKGNWVQGSSTTYQNGNIATTSSHDDNTKTCHPQVAVSTISAPSIGMVPSTNMDNNLDARYKTFSRAFTVGTKLEDDASEGEAQLLLNNFVKGASTTLFFIPTSNMARILGQTLHL